LTSIREHGLDLPLVDAIARRLADGAKGHGDKDLSATFPASEPRQLSASRQR
jgi:hypothetical protein